MPTPTDFSAFRFDQRANDGSYANHGDNFSAEYGQVNPDQTLRISGDATYPNPFHYGYDPGNRQFSSDVDGDPRALLESTREGIQRHPDFNAQYCLNQPNATPGSHPWLRDELTNPTEREPGNAVPREYSKIPYDRG